MVIMRIVNTTCIFPKGYDIFKALDRLKSAGFDVADIALDYYVETNGGFVSDGWREWTMEVKKHAQSIGLELYQCHGVGLPEGFYNNPNDYAYRGLEFAGMTGIKWVVMHPQEIKGRTAPEFDNEFVEKSIKWFGPLIEHAKEVGTGVAIENLPWPNCNRIAPLAAIVDGLRAEHSGAKVGICWDTGHANIFGTRPSEIKVLGDRLVTLHIHDNHGWPDDEHQIPYYGTYDWTEFIHTLREMDYKGEFVLEAHHQMIDAADDIELQNRLMREMLEVSHKILALP